jgi:ATP-dependent DNA helicase RecG
MTIAEAQQLADTGESERLEFKRTTGQRTEAARTVCAFLNGEGGNVLFGVSNAGQLVGQQVADDTLRNLVEALRPLEPTLPIQPEVIQLGNGNALISLSVPAGRDRPYVLDGRPYYRQGSTTAAMPQDLYEQMLADRAHPQRRWELQEASDTTLEDLDLAEITRTVEESIRRGRLDEPSTREPTALLAGLGLLRNGRLLNAAVVLFGKNGRLLPYYPQCSLRMARFSGVTKSEFVDNRQTEGNLFELLVKAQQFLRDHLPIAGRVVPNLFARVDDPLYPPVALREALVNAFCHRDYGVPGGAVNVGIFDDRLEIASTGRLHFGLRPDDLLQLHNSFPWNPLIASVLYRRGIMEQWGRGTQKIVELSTEAGLPTPQFTERAGEVVVSFFPTRYVAPSRIEHNLSALQQQLLEIIGRYTGVASKQLLAELGPVRSAKRTIQDDLSFLAKVGLIERQGWGAGARWYLKGSAIIAQE